MSVLNLAALLLAGGASDVPGGAGGAARLEPRARIAARPTILSTCANPYCRAGWLRLWRRRQTPVFEGGWCCSEECTKARLENAVAREMAGRSEGETSRPHRMPLGLAMLEQGWISAGELRAALAAQRAAGAGRLGHWLVRQQSVTEQQVARALGLQWSCPVLHIDRENGEGPTSLLPRFFIDAFGALPLRVAANRILYLGFEHRPDPALTLAVERITGLRVEGGVVEESLFRSAQTRMLEARFPAAELWEAKSQGPMVRDLTQVLEEAQPRDARLARVHDCLWLRLWLRPQSGPSPEVDSVRDVICSAVSH
jgi:hypothetical protein